MNLAEFYIFRILESNGFTVDNSVLTGESEPVELDVHTTHENQLMSKNMAFYSTFVVRGQVMQLS